MRDIIIALLILEALWATDKIEKLDNTVKDLRNQMRTNSLNDK